MLIDIRVYNSRTAIIRIGKQVKNHLVDSPEKKLPYTTGDSRHSKRCQQDHWKTEGLGRKYNKTGNKSSYYGR